MHTLLHSISLKFYLVPPYTSFALFLYFTENVNSEFIQKCHNVIIFGMDKCEQNCAK